MKSVPFFGFFAPCRCDELGTHRRFRDVQESDVDTARRLYLAFNAVQGFDRAAFGKHAGLEAISLLRLYCPGSDSFQHNMIAAIGFKGLKFRKCVAASCAHYEILEPAG